MVHWFTEVVSNVRPQGRTFILCLFHVLKFCAFQNAVHLIGEEEAGEVNRAQRYRRVGVPHANRRAPTTITLIASTPTFSTVDVHLRAGP